jgi:hypothetical protein
MSKLLTTTSENRPESPEQGDMYLETDTNRVIIWDGSLWQVYNRDSVTQSTGGEDELHYAQGIYSNTDANYYLATSPILHFDSQHVDGVTRTDLSDGDHIPVWSDRTHANHAYYVQSSNTAYSNWEASRLGAGLGGVKLSSTFFKNNSNPNNHSGGTVGSAPEYIDGDGTLFWVIAANNAQQYITPHTYNDWYKSSSGQKFFGTTMAANYGLSTTYWGSATSGTGPALFIGGRSGNSGKVWRADARTDTTKTPLTISSTASGDIRQLGHAYAMTMYEVIWFDSLLPIGEINLVKNYLQNKYAGMHDDYFPASGTTADLLE